MLSAFGKLSKLKLSLVFAVIFFVFSYFLTTVYYIFYNDGLMYLYFSKNDESPLFYESRRQDLLQHLTFIDRLLVIGYHGGYVDSLETLKKVESGVNGFTLEQTLKEIERDGICELNGAKVSKYAYFKTKTLFGLPHTEYVITCNRVETRSNLDLVRNSKTVKSLSR